jgi:hypothetical protein
VAAAVTAGGPVRSAGVVPAPGPEGQHPPVRATKAVHADVLRIAGLGDVLLHRRDDAAGVQHLVRLVEELGLGHASSALYGRHLLLAVADRRAEFALAESGSLTPRLDLATHGLQNGNGLVVVGGTGRAAP